MHLTRGIAVSVSWWPGREPAASPKLAYTSGTKQCGQKGLETTGLGSENPHGVPSDTEALPHCREHDGLRVPGPSLVGATAADTDPSAQGWGFKHTATLPVGGCTIPAVHGAERPCV